MLNSLGKNVPTGCTSALFLLMNLNVFRVEYVVWVHIRRLVTRSLHDKIRECIRNRISAIIIRQHDTRLVLYVFFYRLYIYVCIIWYNRLLPNGLCKQTICFVKFFYANLKSRQSVGWFSVTSISLLSMSKFIWLLPWPWRLTWNRARFNSIEK